VALVVSCVTFDYFFVESLYTLDISRSDTAYFTVFASFASLITWLAKAFGLRNLGGCFPKPRG